MSRRAWVPIAVCGSWLALAGCRCGEPDRVGEPGPLAVTMDRPAVLAVLPDEAPAVEREFFFGDRGGGVAWAEPQGGGLQLVHNGRAGKRYAAVGAIALSPDGRRCAHGALAGGTWRMVVDGQEGQGFDEVQDPVFSPDGRHLAYQARAGQRWHLVVDATPSRASLTRFLRPEFSGDSARIAFIEEADVQGLGRLVVSDLAFKAPVVVDAHAGELVVNTGRTWAAAVSASEGQAQVVSFAFERPAEPRRGPRFEAVARLAFGPDGRSLACLGERAGQSFMVLDGKEEALPPGQYFGPPVILPGRKEVGIFLLSGDSVRLHHAFAAAGAADLVREGGEELAFSSAGVPAYVSSRGGAQVVVVGGHQGPAFDRVVNPAFSPDGRLVVYRARKDGRRFVVVAGLDGTTIRQHPGYEQVFPVRFTADGRSVAYGVKDGPRLAWKVEPL